jgi:NitT/TauT family transport system permease protein
MSLELAADRIRTADPPFSVHGDGAEPVEQSRRKPRFRLDLREISRRWTAIALFLLAWEVLPRAGVINAAFLPPVSQVATFLVRTLLSGELERHILISLSRSLAGFSLAFSVALPLGFLLGWFKTFERYVDPLIQVFRQTSAFALFPLFILVLGIGEVSKVAIIFYGAQWPILLNTISGVKNVDPLLVKSARSLGLGRFDLFRKIILPAALPSIFTGLRLAATFSILIIVSAEMMGASAGLGYVLTNSQYNFDILRMYSAIVSLALIGLGTNHLLVSLERHFTGWKPETTHF